MKIWVGAPLRNRVHQTLFGVMMILLIAASGCINQKQTDSVTQANHDSLARFRPADSELKGWQQVWEAKTIAEWPEEQRKTFLTIGIDEAAGWRYTKDSETLEIWARTFKSDDALTKVEDGITSPLFWKDQSALAFADMSMVGQHIERDKPNPLLLYMAQNRTMFYVDYYNDNGKYQPAHITEDKAFLVKLAKDMLAKY